MVLGEYDVAVIGGGHALWGGFGGGKIGYENGYVFNKP